MRSEDGGAQSPPLDGTRPSRAIRWFAKRHSARHTRASFARWASRSLEPSPGHTTLGSAGVASHWPPRLQRRQSQGLSVGRDKELLRSWGLEPGCPAWISSSVDLLPSIGRDAQLMGGSKSCGRPGWQARYRCHDSGLARSVSGLLARRHSDCPDAAVVRGCGRVPNRYSPLLESAQPIRRSVRAGVRQHRTRPVPGFEPGAIRTIREGGHRRRDSGRRDGCC